MKKVLMIVLLGELMCFTLTGCGDKENTKPNNDNNNQQEEKQNNNSLGIGKYKVEKSGNSIFVITNDGSAISTIEYKFTSETLISATLTQKYSSSDLAKTMYNTMKDEPTMTNQYIDMKLSGDTITMNLKSEMLSVYSSMDQNAIYDLMYQTYSLYME